MKKILKIVLLVIIIIAILVLLGFGIKKLYDGYIKEKSTEYDWIASHVVLTTNNSVGENVLTVSKNKHISIFNENYQKVSELSDFISQYVKEAGKEQAILDFQVGLNLLNGYKKSSPVEAKIKLEEDSDFGEKTFAALFNVFKNYPVDVVKKFVKLGAINNRIWNTKNNKSIDTDSEVEKVTDKLNERGY